MENGEAKEGEISESAVLKQFNWRTQIKLSDKNLSYQKKPHALLMFKIGNEENDEKDENLVLEFNQSELYKFFQELETIQSRLDTVYK